MTGPSKQDRDERILVPEFSVEDPYRFDVSWATNTGGVRETNEDRYCAVSGREDLPRGLHGFYAVADGMGGQANGEIAAQAAVDELTERLRGRSEKDWPVASGDREQALKRLVQLANQKVSDEAQRRDSDMGSTLVLAARFGNRVAVANVGDSRAYMVGPAGIRQITRDHSRVQELVDSGSITSEEAKIHPQKNVITRTLGDESGNTPDIFEEHIPDGGGILLCSDGLTNMLSDQEIHKIVQGSGSAEDACQRLIQAANRAGGRKGASDNVTVVFIKNQGRAVELSPDPHQQTEMDLSRGTTGQITERGAASLREVFRRDCLGAGYNIFQLVEAVVGRESPGEFRPRKPFVFWASADSSRETDRFVKSAIPETDQVEARAFQLWNMWTPDVPEGDPGGYRVGNSIVMLADGEVQGTSFVIIYGAISAEFAGTWKGGRTNCENFVIFELEGGDAIDRFLAAIDTDAKAYEAGTERNYQVIVETMSGVFPEQVMKFVRSHMFRRQEIQKVVDSREPIHHSAEGEPPRREEGPIEIELTPVVSEFMTGLEELAKMEEPQAASLSTRELRAHFDKMTSLFSNLSQDLPGRTLRAEIFKKVIADLGEAGTALKTAGRSEDFIFQEWLKRILLHFPL